MQSLSDTPDETFVHRSVTSKEEKAAAYESVGKIIIQEFLDPEFHKEKPKAMKMAGSSPKKQYEKSWTTFKSTLKNCSHCFTSELQDGIWEGDGLRVLRCWKYLFLFF